MNFFHARRKVVSSSGDVGTRPGDNNSADQRDQRRKSGTYGCCRRKLYHAPSKTSRACRASSNNLSSEITNDTLILLWYLAKGCSGIFSATSVWRYQLF